MGRAYYQVLIFTILVMAGCVKDKPPVVVNTTSGTGNGVFIVCEGQYSTPTGSLYYYNPATDSVFGDYFSGVNKQPLGDVFQSMTRLGSHYFLAINNSGKIAVINTADYLLVKNIPVPFPRYIAPVSDSTALVTSLYNSHVFVLNTNSLSITDSITLPASNTESVCPGYNNDAFVCAWDTATDKIFRVDLSTRQIIQNIKVAGRAPHNILADKEGMLWVLSGNQPKGKQAWWTRIDPSTGNILVSIPFPTAAEPIKPVFNNTKDTLYFIEANYYGGTANNGIFRMGIHETTIPTTPFISAATNQYYWALGIDPSTGNIYVGDPLGFNQKGTFSIYRPDASLKATHRVGGIGPGQFYFN